MTFSGKISFPLKVPEFLLVLFNFISRKTFSCIFLGLNALVQLCCVYCACFDILCLFFQKQSANQPKKIQGEYFTTSSKSTCKKIHHR